MPSRSALVMLLFGCASPAQEPAGALPLASPAPANVQARLGGAARLGSPPPYGFWGMNGYLTAGGLRSLARDVQMSVVQTATNDPAWAVGTLLPMARDAGVKVTLRMTADHDAYTTRRGDFSLSAWKLMLAPWAGSGVQAFIDDHTLVGHMLLDDISNFEGRDPDAADLDEMARYSKELMPGLMTFVRENAAEMPEPVSGTYVHVDASVNQYKAAEGDVRTYAATQAGHARTLDLGVINGLNIANGGDGSSGQPGWQSKRFAMSAGEIRRYGAVHADVPACGMFLNWEYDGEEPWPDGTLGSDYFNRTALKGALADIGARMAAHEPVQLLKREGG